MDISSKLTLRNQLVTALSNEIGAEDAFCEVISDLKEFSANASIDWSSFRQGSRANLKRLLDLCEVYSLTSLLRDILSSICNDGRRSWPSLQQCFSEYQQSLQSEPGANHYDLFNIRQLEASNGSVRRKQLLALAGKYAEVGGPRFSDVISQALASAHPDAPPSSVYPSVFCGGELAGWNDLICSTSEENFELDQIFLDALRLALERPASVTKGHLSSLIVMLLKPLNDVSRYDFRAYFCLDEFTPSEDWVRVDAKPIDPPIRISNWIADLRPLLLESLRAAQLLRQDHRKPLLLEVFLPSELLNEDFADHIRLENLNRPSDPLWKNFPIVLRSSARFQFFCEGKTSAAFSPLSLKWPLANQQEGDSNAPRCFWWHDAFPATGKHTAKRAEEMAKRFDVLRIKPDYFGFKRIANLPTCRTMLGQWIDEVISASPAVALWWRAGAKSKRESRQVCFESFCQDSGARAFGFSEPQANDPHLSDPFTHPFADRPLRLFLSLATVQHYGQVESGPTAQAFREMVILVDCVERWPPPVDVSPAGQPEPGQQGPVIVAVDEILMSG